MTGFTTTAIHGVRSKETPHGTLRVPIYDSVSFEHEDSKAIQQAFEGKRPAHTYSRISNPTVTHLEQTLRLLSGGVAVLAVSSGMAAISNTILALGSSGKNIVTTRHLFGNTLSLFEKTLFAWGLEVRYVSMNDMSAVDAAIDKDTCCVFLESITNPQLEVADCNAISAVAGKHGVPLVADNTLMTPYLFNSRKNGVDIEILSSTKYISGGGTTVGGIIIDNGTFNWSQSAKLKEYATQYGPMTCIARLRQEIYRNVGACLSPHNASMQSLGLETLSLRIDKSCKGCLEIAHFLSRHPSVMATHYPGLSNSASYGIARKQFGSQSGGILTFDLKDTEQCFKLMDSLNIIRRATNVNDNKSLIIHPWSTIFAEYCDEDKYSTGIRPTMLRLAVGIEDTDDLIKDLKQGLEQL